MSRVANSPIKLPNGVEVTVQGSAIKIKGGKGVIEHIAPKVVQVTQADHTLTLEYDVNDVNANMQAGTTRALLNNMVTGVSKGFEKKLELVGVGYRAQAQGNVLNLTLGFSHPIKYAVPTGITVETPSQTEIIVKGIDKQKVGQTAAEIRAFRPPEPYKGKGIKLTTERIVRKETKKK